jgi:hypothetical protein
LLSGSFTAVPRELWWDNEAGIGRRGRLTEPVTALVGTLRSRLVQLKPYDPESSVLLCDPGLLLTDDRGPNLLDHRRHCTGQQRG